MDQFEEDDINPMVGSDPSMQEIRRHRQAAATDVTILITGESGVGKEAVADRVYSMSRREGEALKSRGQLRCHSQNLLESELFGYEKGAFTGASLKEGKMGLSEAGQSAWHSPAGRDRRPPYRAS